LFAARTISSARHSSIDFLLEKEDENAPAAIFFSAMSSLL
jgi:hypothetical protein